MKMVPCSYANCGDRRIHWCQPDVPRGTQMIQVEDDHTGPMYCSFECAMYDGAYSLKEGWIKKP
jgi:hypothetical protein